MDSRFRLPRALAAAVILSFSCIASPISAATIFVATLRAPTGATESGGHLYSVDDATGKSTVVGRVLIDGTQAVGITAMAFHPVTKVLYAVTDINDSKRPTLIKVDAETAQARTVGRLSLPLSDISFDPTGRLYGWTANTGQLAMVDIQTGKVSLSGPVVRPAVGGAFAIDAHGNALVAVWSPPPVLDRVNLKDGAVEIGSRVSNLHDATSLRSMAFSTKGELLAVHTTRAAHAASALVRIDTTSGAATSIADIPDDAEAIAVLPEGGASTGWQRWGPYALLGAMLLAVWHYRRERRNAR